MRKSIDVFLLNATHNNSRTAMNTVTSTTVYIVQNAAGVAVAPPATFESLAAAIAYCVPNVGEYEITAVTQVTVTAAP